MPLEVHARQRTGGTTQVMKVFVQEDGQFARRQGSAKSTSRHAHTEPTAPTGRPGRSGGVPSGYDAEKVGGLWVGEKRFRQPVAQGRAVADLFAKRWQTSADEVVYRRD